MLFPTILLMIVSVIVFYLEYKRIKQKQAKKDNWVFMIFMVLATIFLFVYMCDLPTPDFVAFFEFLFKPIRGPFFTWLIQYQ
ncbi:multisubunit Na+/H+ antiporter MnhB subunit [Natronobacillus azotifigens]|uniref:Uncharacterized protein n=1 Tax=Natronobacillus azotifigens TaxID=472978 RepID=A0A9J6R8X4_9BACI|nr:hypothetical protein [Natronobacillus azotifigens]MCZ0702069.1 hypothetical protein [Natronobacillus azotifigens]